MRPFSERLRRCPKPTEVGERAGVGAVVAQGVAAGEAGARAEVRAAVERVVARVVARVATARVPAMEVVGMEGGGRVCGGGGPRL